MVNWAFTTQTENFCFAQILRERACDGENAICEAPFSPKTKMIMNRKTHITFERICVMTGVFGLWSQDVIGRRDALHWRFHSIQHKFVIGKELEIDLEKKRTNNLNPLTHHSV